MDSLDFNSTQVTDDTYTAVGQKIYDKIRGLGNLARVVIDVCFVLLLISCSSIYLPMVFKMASEFLREMSNLVSSTHAIFVIGNVIIIALVAQSGKFSSQNEGSKKYVISDNFYDEYVKNSESRRGNLANIVESPVKQNVIISSEKSQVGPINELSGTDTVNESLSSVTDTVTVPESSLKSYRRTRSDTFERTDRVKAHKELCRSETEITKCTQPSKNGGEETERRMDNVVDQLSNEEFQRRIEAFIQKQQRFLRDEYLSVVVDEIDNYRS